MLSLRVKALLHSGQRASFRPVCFFACRAACPEVVKKSWHWYCLANGHGYWFLPFRLLLELLLLWRMEGLDSWGSGCSVGSSGTSSYIALFWPASCDWSTYSEMSGDLG